MIHHHQAARQRQILHGPSRSGKASLIAVLSEEEPIIISDLGDVQTSKMHTAVWCLFQSQIRKQDESDKADTRAKLWSSEEEGITNRGQTAEEGRTNVMAELQRLQSSSTLHRKRSSGSGARGALPRGASTGRTDGRTGQPVSQLARQPDRPKLVARAHT